MSNGGPFGAGSVAESYQHYLEPTIFTPWAAHLIEFVGVEPAQVVLDVAAGTGAVARAAAAAVGDDGTVYASDISPTMLAVAAADAVAGRCTIQSMICPATELALPDSSVDVVLCQQGLPFIRDRPAALQEFHRVLRPGGAAGLAVWVAGVRLEPFDTYADVLRAEGVPEPFRNAYDNAKVGISPDGMFELLTGAGFERIDVAVEQKVLHWPSAETAALAISGTPYGPAVAQLPADRREAVLHALQSAFTDPSRGSVVPLVTAAVVARGVAA